MWIEPIKSYKKGDENEKRIEQLETKLNTILEIIQEETSEPQENEEDIQTDICYSVVSDHSSIPYLIECSETVSNMTDELEDEDNLSFNITVNVILPKKGQSYATAVFSNGIYRILDNIWGYIGSSFSYSEHIFYYHPKKFYINIMGSIH